MSDILVMGGGKAGSWKIRGEQLGAAIGATVDPLAQRLNGYRLAVLVKHPKLDSMQRVQRAGIPLVWDIVDAWRIGCDDDAGRETCLSWLRDRAAWLRPAAIVAATRAMASDCAAFGVPVLTLPHHARPEQAVNPIREQVRKVGYDGRVEYLGWWRGFMDTECARRGWSFEVNPLQLADLDIVVALREKRGYGATRWKSNVKLANAQATGTPCILNSEAGYEETASGGEYWADSPEQMVAALDALEDVNERRRRGDALRAKTITLEDAAKTYKTWLAQLNS